jgi:hypothetical protein
MSAKLPTVRFVFFKDKQQHHFEIQPKISTDFKFFFATKELPKAFFEIEGKPYTDRLYFDTFHELRDSIDKMIDEIEMSEVEENKTKVILYSVDTESNRGVLIDFRWKVLHKVEVTKQTKKGVVKDVTFFEEHRRGSDYHKSVSFDSCNLYNYFSEDIEEMIWTGEREAWFRSIEIAINDLTKKIKAGFGSQSSVLAKRIDAGAGSFLLQAPPEREAKRAKKK